MATQKQTAASAALPKAPYATLEKVHHNGKLYPKGNTVRLTVDEGARLVQLGSVLPIKDGTDADDVNLAIDLKTLSQAELAAHATTRYNLTLPAETTIEAYIEAIEAARAAQARA